MHNIQSTSINTFFRIMGSLPERERQVYRVIKNSPVPLTDMEIASQYGFDLSSELDPKQTYE